MSTRTRTSRQEIEDFLFDEAALLDEWRLEEWLDLFTEDGTYEIPTNDAPDRSPIDTLSYVADEPYRLRARIKRLQSPHAHVENPHSRTRRLITNVRVLHEDDDTVEATANFVVYRMKHGYEDAYVGRFHYIFDASGESLRIKRKRAVLDADYLRPTGIVSIIL